MVKSREELIDNVISVNGNNFTDKDETHHCFDKKDKEHILSIFFWISFLCVAYLLLRNVFGFNDYDFRRKWAPRTAGDLSCILLFRSVFIELVFVPFFTLSVSTLSSIMLQRKLARGRRVTRGNTRGGAREYGFHPYEVIGPMFFLPFYFKILKFAKQSQILEKVLYPLLATVDSRQGRFQAYTTGNIQEQLVQLELNLNLTHISGKRSEFQKRLKTTSLYSGREDILKAIIVDNFKYIKCKQLRLVCRGGLEGFKLVRRIRKYNKRLRQLKKVMELEGYSSLPDFCGKIKRNENGLFSKEPPRENNGLGCLNFRTKGHRNIDYGLLYNRVRRSAGVILLHERESARILNVRGRYWNSIYALIIILLGFFMKILVESAINAAGNEVLTNSYDAIVPYQLNSSEPSQRWNCTRIIDNRIELAPFKKEGNDCLWSIGSANETKLISVGFSKIKRKASVFSNGTHWTADGSFICEDQTVSNSMLVERDTVAPGGFLQVCWNEFDSIMLIMDKFDKPGYPLESFRDVIIYKSDWISEPVAKDISQIVGVRNFKDLDALLLSSIRDVGVRGVIENYTFHKERVKNIINRPKIIYAVLGFLFLLSFIAFALKKCFLETSGKINIRSDDGSMLCTLSVCMFDEEDEPNLPVSNVVVRRLTPEIKLTEGNHGTYFIDVKPTHGSKTSFEVLKDPSNIPTFIQKTKTFFSPENLSNFFSCKKTNTSYDEISWEEIQCDSGKLS